MIHCTGGKDRTGVFAALLLTILGAPLDVVVQDYMLTGEYMASDENLRRARADFQKLAGGSEPPDLETMRRLNATEPEAITGIFDTIARQYGSFDAFVRNGMKLTDAEVASLKARLLE